MYSLSNTTWRNLFSRHGLLIILAAASLLLMLMGGTVTEALRYERTSIFAGQIWRLVTGNLVHLGWPHLFMNLAGLVLIWILFGHQMSQARWWAIALISALSVSIGLLILNPDLIWYVGLSGVLHGLFAAGLVTSLRASLRWEEAALLAAFAGKIIWETLYGALPGSEETAGGPVIVAAHLYGAIGGGATVAGFLFSGLKRP